jgi:hypothetical protein
MALFGVVEKNELFPQYVMLQGVNKDLLMYSHSL